MSRVLAPTRRVGSDPVSSPTFSIVIAAYEAAATIAAAVESALEQTRPAAQVIVVDDGSRDEIDTALSPFIDRIVFIRKENGGGASARNAGIAVAECDYLAILDADDRYDSRRLEALAELAEDRPDLDLVTTDARFIVEGDPVGSFLSHNSFPVDDQRLAIFESCFPGGWPAVRLRTLREVGGFDESFKIAYDWDCWLRMILAGSEAGIVDEPYYDYVLHEGSLASSRLASLEERVRLLESASVNPDLREDERPALETGLAARRLQLCWAIVAASLNGEVPRSRMLAAARARAIPARTRALALVSYLCPPLGRKLVKPEPAPDRRFSGDE